MKQILVLFLTSLIAVFLLIPFIAFAKERKCSDFRNWHEAQTYFEEKGGSSKNNIDHLDQNKDGIVCDKLNGYHFGYKNQNNTKVLSGNINQTSSSLRGMLFSITILMIGVMGFLSRKALGI